RPADVRWRSRPPAWATRPSATRRRNISLAACVVTPSWRAICAVVARPLSSEPTRTRSARRYSWAALDRSRWSCRRGGMPSGYGTRRRGWDAHPPDDRDRDSGKPGDEEDGTERDTARVTVGGFTRRRQDEGGRDRGAEQCDGSHRRDRRDHGKGEQGEERPDLEGEDDRVRQS